MNYLNDYETFAKVRKFFQFDFDGDVQCDVQGNSDATFFLYLNFLFQDASSSHRREKSRFAL